MINLKIKNYLTLIIFSFIFFCVPNQLLAKTNIEKEILVLQNSNQSNDTRLEAAVKLVQSDSDKAMITLSNILKNNPNWMTRKHVAYALGFSSNKNAVSLLINALENDRNDTVRSDAALSLGKIRDERAFNALVSTLSFDPNVFVRSDAAKALGMLGDKKAFNALKNALTDKGTIIKFEDGEEKAERIVTTSAKDALFALNLGHLVDLSKFEEKEISPQKVRPWIIQVASLKKHKDALDEMKKFINLGFNAYIAKKESGKKKWYRIRIGFYNSRKEAQNKIDKLMGKHTIRDAFIIRPNWEEVNNYFEENIK